MHGMSAPWPCASECLRWPPVWSRSAGHAEWKQGPQASQTCCWPDGESSECCGGWQTPVVRLGFVPLLVGKDWIVILRRVVRLMASLLKSVNLVSCFVQFLITLKQSYSAKVTRSTACPLRGLAGVVQGRLSVSRPSCTPSSVASHCLWYLGVRGPRIGEQAFPPLLLSGLVDHREPVSLVAVCQSLPISMGLGRSDFLLGLI